MNLGGLLKDKKTLYIGGAAALGLGALWAYSRKGNAGGGGTSQPQGVLDASSTDMAQALNQAEGAWSGDLRNFGDQLQNLMDRLNTLPPGGTGNPSGNPLPGGPPPNVPPRPIGPQAPARTRPAIVPTSAGSSVLGKIGIRDR